MSDRKCDVEGCNRKGDRVFPDNRSKRICETHFKRWEKTGRFAVNRPEGWGEERNRKYKEKECIHCKQVKKIAAKGLCRACYYRLNKTGSLEYQRKGKINICSVEGCTDRVVSNGLCDKHRKSMERHGKINHRPSDWGERQKHPLYHYWSDTKRRETLNICEEWKNDFWSFVDCVKERPSKNHFLRAVDVNQLLGPGNWRWVEGLTEASRQMANNFKRSVSDRKRAKVSREEREQLLLKVNHCCEICGTDTSNNDCPVTGTERKTLCIDHDHETGELRGVLCRACNSGLGHFKDSPALLQAAIDYLNSH